MQLSAMLTTCCAAAMAFSAAIADSIMVPVPWYITDLSISNIRHGSGGTWKFNIQDTPTTQPQGFNTSCLYQDPAAYYFAHDGAPFNQPCDDPSITFSLYYEQERNEFRFNITHLWGNCGTNQAPIKCNDNGTWAFSHDDVSGQQMDAENNFGQAGYFSRAWLSMYPKRAVPSEKCEFC